MVTRLPPSNLAQMATNDRVYLLKRCLLFSIIIWLQLLAEGDLRFSQAICALRFALSAERKDHLITVRQGLHSHA